MTPPRTPEDDETPLYRESWADRVVREATERGEFSNLPGEGKPISGLDKRDDDWWVKGMLERERISMPLPPSLQLRKDVAELPEQLADVRREDDAREIIEALNDRIRDSHRRRLDGPVIHVGLVDVEQSLARWREARRTRP
ncbi:DUF1992 domain-containing protein [Propionibacteriaceae bacterium Y2011]|uniref:DnaJ family domain-containing protein n=1 Tax=Microlunatus sp. Y2014 TaxID=3418488 RepID=UPI003B4F721F